MKKSKDKLFVVRKYVWAQDAKGALRKEKNTPVDDVWIDEKWKENSVLTQQNPIGFYVKKRG